MPGTSVISSAALPDGACTCIFELCILTCLLSLEAQVWGHGGQRLQKEKLGFAEEQRTGSRANGLSSEWRSARTLELEPVRCASSANRVARRRSVQHLRGDAASRRSAWGHERTAQSRHSSGRQAPGAQRARKAFSGAGINGHSWALYLASTGSASATLRCMALGSWSLSIRYERGLVAIAIAGAKAGGVRPLRCTTRCADEMC
jgi:hypothetical protein